jgi:ATP-dependent protease HslVU (ClpYQ) peptidase subunit
MTVIAWDGKTLAADGLMTNGQTVASTHTQKIFRANEVLFRKWKMCGKSILAFGYAGYYGDQYPVIDALNLELTPDTVFNSDTKFTAIMIDSVGMTWLVDKGDKEIHARIYPAGAEVVAIGSGADAAYGALRAGRGATEAVLIACECNVYCGGDIQHWTPQRRHGGIESVEGQSLWMAMGMVN